MERVAYLSVNGNGDVVVFAPSVGARTFGSASALESAVAWCESQGYRVQYTFRTSRKEV